MTDSLSSKVALETDKPPQRYQRGDGPDGGTANGDPLEVSLLLDRVEPLCVEVASQTHDGDE